MIISPYRFASAAGGGDPYWANVVSLLHFDGADASTTFTDSSLLARVYTAAGNAQISTANKKYGTGSAIFDGSGDYVTTPYTASDFDWWTSDFTIECWVYAASWANWSYVDGSPNPAMLGCAVVSSFTNCWSFGPRADGSLCFYYYNGTSGNRVTGGTIPLNQWNHIAMVKTSAGITLYLNGTSVAGPISIVGTPVSNQPSVVLTIGQINNRSIQGNIDDLRMSRFARYTGNFTPPTAPFPNHA
jgi:hypothetical protein